MSKSQKQVTTALVLPESPNEPSQLNNLFKEYLYHWPLFVLTTIVALVLAFYYVKVTAPVYPISASIQFTNRTTDSYEPVQQGSLDQLNPVSQPINVEDEINVIKSKKTIYQVVQKLQLWVDYTTKNGLRIEELYKTSPVAFRFTDTSTLLSPEGAQLEVTIKDAHSFLVKEDTVASREVAFSTPVTSDFGTWQLDPTPYLKDYIGSTITIYINDADLITDAYQAGIKIEQENKYGAFLNISMTDHIPERGRDVLNLLTQLYQANAQKEKFGKTQEILQFMDLRLDSIQHQLDSIEGIIQRYKNQQGFSDIAMDAQNSRNLQSSNELSLTGVNVKLSTLNTLQAYANSSQVDVKLPPGGDLGDNNLQSLYNKLADLQLEREQKLATMPAANPIIVALDKQLNSLKKDFNDKLREKINTETTAALANKGQLNAFKANVQSTLSKVPSQQKKIDSLLREEDSKKTLFRFLSDKREQLALQYVSLLPDFKIVDDAHAGIQKWPVIPVVYGLALILGLGLAAGILAMRKMLNERIRTRQQVEQETEAPVLGEISANRTKSQIVVTEKRSNFIIGEQFRILRTNLYYLLADKPGCHVTLFTSSVSGEGKTFISSNLCITMAYGSRKTVILGMDLRRPRLAPVFGLSEEHSGISDYLSGEISDLDKLIRPSGIAGLDVLTCGSVLPNPSELLESERLELLIKELKAKYDEIIIDSPPIHLVTDAMIIARVADVSLYVVRQNYTHKDELGFIKEIYEDKRFQMLNLVVNGVQAGAGYGYGYGNYGYSHYNAYADKPKWSLAKSVKAGLQRF